MRSGTTLFDLITASVSGQGQEMESRRRKPSLPRRPPLSLRDPPKSRVFDDLSDTTRRKKVKFAESATVLGTTSSHDFPSIQAQISRSPNFNDPKTFEYKFFKEIWEKTSCNHKNLQFSVEKIDTRFSKRNDGMQETSSSITSRHEIGSSSGTGITIPVANTHSLSLVFPVDNEHENGGIFSIKRKRLLQIVAETFPLVESKSELSRLDLIPLLLQRLGIDKELHEPKCEEFPESVKNASCGQIQLPSSFNSYFFDKENTAIATELVASEDMEHLHKDRPSRTWSRDYDDELRRLQWDYNTNLQDFPNWPVVENSLLQKDQTSSELVYKPEVSELHDCEMSPPLIEWSSSFKGRSCTNLFIRPEYKDLSNYIHCLPTNQPKLLNILDPSSPGEKGTLPLLQWKEIAEEPDYSLASPSFVFPEMDNSNVCSASRLHVEMRNGYRKDDIFNFLRSDDREMMLHGATNGYLDIFPPKLETAFGLKWKTLPLDIATRCHFSNHMEVQLYERDSFVFAGCSFDDIDEEDDLNHRLLV